MILKKTAWLTQIFQTPIFFHSSSANPPLKKPGADCTRNNHSLDDGCGCGCNDSESFSGNRRERKSESKGKMKT
ncbi:uncharacterized protein BYT42DRAFT_570018 [Radiomyces spectabilis]|uniref:uncharacterized protein n=1 Tax=Radiomyces spectabilis TaxID=64574 RepID=UPI0022204AD0|nr:uncharacterized protein BYT42DRAFT_570018 [Radiomyces spectabilis]KAI8379788.1 hypothetical protein BYT42DRAFT_570018 [Radiomyces spectabilis]